MHVANVPGLEPEAVPKFSTRLCGTKAFFSLEFVNRLLFVLLIL